MSDPRRMWRIRLSTADSLDGGWDAGRRGAGPTCISACHADAVGTSAHSSHGLPAPARPQGMGAATDRREDPALPSRRTDRLRPPSPHPTRQRTGPWAVLARISPGGGEGNVRAGAAAPLTCDHNVIRGMETSI